MSNLRNSLQAIYDAHGSLTPGRVVDEWRDPDHPDHNRLTWDDEVAGEAYRREEARRIIRSVKIVDNRDPLRPRHIREFVSVARGSSSPPTYMPTTEAMSDEFTRKLVLQGMQRDIATLQRKYAHLKEFSDAIAELWKGA